MSSEEITPSLVYFQKSTKKKKSLHYLLVCIVSDKKPDVIPVYVVSLFLHFYWNIVDLQACQYRIYKKLRFDPWMGKWGRSPGGEHGNLLQYSCLGNPVDRGAWGAVVHGTAKMQIQLKRLSTHTGIVGLQCCVAFLNCSKICMTSGLPS